MGPHELIEWILYGIFGLIVLPIVVFGFVKTGKKRMLALMTAGVLCLMFGSFLMSQPDEEDIKAADSGKRGSRQTVSCERVSGRKVDDLDRTLSKRRISARQSLFHNRCFSK